VLVARPFFGDSKHSCKLLVFGGCQIFEVAFAVVESVVVSVVTFHPLRGVHYQAVHIGISLLTINGGCL